MILPNLIIAGAPKCGTSSLFEYLSLHPEVCPSSKKETCYLIDEKYPLYDVKNNYHKNSLSGYQEYFSQCNSELIPILMEATPDYLYQKTPLKALREFSNKPKIIIILRKPSTRVYSMFQFARNNMATMRKNIQFPEYIDMVIKGDEYLETRVLLKNAIEQSRYENYLPAWIDAVSERNVKICLFEDMISNTQNFMYQIANYLEIDKTYYNNYKFECSNETYQVKHQWLHKQMRKYSSVIDNKIMRNSIKKMYYGLNLQFTKPTKTSEVKKTLSMLDEMFTSTYTNLEETYHIDLSRWK